MVPGAGTLRLLLFALLSLTLAEAQKAEPQRIQFARGSFSATVDGKLNGAEQMEYVVGAGANQTMTLDLTDTPPKSVTPLVLDTDLKQLPIQPNHTVKIPAKGDYLIWLPRTAIGEGQSTYKLTVTIK